MNQGREKNSSETRSRYETRTEKKTRLKADKGMKHRRKKNSS